MSEAQQRSTAAIRPTPSGPLRVLLAAPASRWRWNLARLLGDRTHRSVRSECRRPGGPRAVGQPRHNTHVSVHRCAHSAAATRRAHGALGPRRVSCMRPPPRVPGGFAPWPSSPRRAVLGLHEESSLRPPARPQCARCYQPRRDRSGAAGDAGAAQRGGLHRRHGLPSAATRWARRRHPRAHPRTPMPTTLRPTSAGMQRSTPRPSAPAQVRAGQGLELPVASCLVRKWPQSGRHPLCPHERP